MSEHASTGFRLKGVHVLASMLVFFGVIISVNITFVTMAARSFPGLASEEPFKRGLAKDFNQRLEDRAVQAERGWTAAVSHRFEPAEQRAHVRVTLARANGEPIADRPVTGVLQRVVTADADRAVVFSPLGDGVYAAVISDVAPGEWRLLVRTDFPDGAPFEAEARLWME